MTDEREQTIEELRGTLLPASQQQPQQPSGGVIVQSDRAMQLIRGQMQMAMMQPRNEGVALTRILESCDVLGMAENSFYSFRRGGSVISGPSIDLLKGCARYWKNIMFNVAEIERRQNESTALAWALDLETNAFSSREFIVRHIRDKNNDSGQNQGVYLTSERDIYELIANYGSRRLRSCLEDLIPPHIVQAAYDRCQATLKRAAEKVPLAQRLADLVPAFGKLGVTEAMLVKFLGGRALGSMLEAEYIRLRNIYRSIETGAQRVEEFFDKPTVKDAVEAGKGKNAGATGAAAGGQPGAGQQPQNPAAAAPAAEKAKPQRARPTSTGAAAAAPAQQTGSPGAAGTPPPADAEQQPQQQLAGDWGEDEEQQGREPGSDDAAGEEDQGPPETKEEFTALLNAAKSVAEVNAVLPILQACRTLSPDEVKAVKAHARGRVKAFESIGKGAEPQQPTVE